VGRLGDGPPFSQDAARPAFNPRQCFAATNVPMRLILIPILAFLLSGCLARTAVDLVTLPVKVVSAGVDAATTSQSEADQRRGREIREEEERLGRLARRCARNPDREECAELQTRQDGFEATPQ
jgi:hypothetical protein